MKWIRRLPAEFSSRDIVKKVLSSGYKPSPYILAKYKENERFRKCQRQLMATLAARQKESPGDLRRFRSGLIHLKG